MTYFNLQSHSQAIKWRFNFTDIKFKLGISVPEICVDKTLLISVTVISNDFVKAIHLV